MTSVGPGAFLGDRYLLIKPLGSGAYGEVWRAEDRHRNYHVAIKLLKDKNKVAAWREASILTGLRSPHILEVHNADVFVDVPYLDTALASSSLDVTCAPLGMEPSDAVEVMRRTLRGLHLAHQRGLVHRDIKPANIFLDSRGDARLGDFGIAEVIDPATNGARQKGDPYFLNPESYAGTLFTIQSDIYSAGLALYNLLTGVRPFNQTTHPELERAIISGDYQPLRDAAPHVSRALDQVFKKSVQLDPRQRFSTAAEFDSALGALPRRTRHFRPIFSHAGHDRCWEATGRSSPLFICALSTGGGAEIVTTHQSSGRRVASACMSLPTHRLALSLRGVFDVLRTG